MNSKQIGSHKVVDAVTGETLDGVDGGSLEYFPQWAEKSGACWVPVAANRKSVTARLVRLADR